MRSYAEFNPVVGHVLLLCHAELRSKTPICWTCPVAISSGVTQKIAQSSDTLFRHVMGIYKANRPAARHVLSLCCGELRKKPPICWTRPFATSSGVTRKIAQSLDAPFRHVVRIYAVNRPVVRRVLLLCCGELHRKPPIRWICTVAMSCEAIQSSTHLFDAPCRYFMRSYAAKRPFVGRVLLLFQAVLHRISPTR